MSKVDFPVSLDSYFFTRTHVESIPGHDPTKPGGALRPDNNISLNEIPNEPHVFQAVMRTLINAERDPKYPYFIDMECVAFLRVVETLPPDEARRGVMMIGHNVLYGAIREAVSWVTGNHPYGKLTLGLSILRGPQEQDPGK